MNIKRQLIKGHGFVVPSAVIKAQKPVGTAVIVEGYGGCKEEQLGLAWRLAEAGVRTCTIDLRGHGENILKFDEKVFSDVEAAVKYFHRFGKVVAVGHSLGGRLALLSKADFVVGISPAFNKTFSPETQEYVKSLRNYRVRKDDEDIVFKTLYKLPEWKYTGQTNVELICGTRDVPEIMQKCDEFKLQGASVTIVNEAYHSDIFVLEETFSRIITRLREWFEMD